MTADLREKQTTINVQEKANLSDIEIMIFFH